MKSAGASGPVPVGRRRGGPEVADDGALFEAIFSSAAIGIALVDMDGHPVVSNPALERMLGYTGVELREMAFTEFTHPEDASADWDLFQELIAGDRDHYEMEKRYIRRDGQIVWGRLTVSLIRTIDGAPRFAVGMVEDVTERNRFEDRYRTLVEQLPGIVYTAEFGEAGRWQYASPFATALLGFSSEEWLSDPFLWWHHVHPDDRERVLEEERSSEATGRPLDSRVPDVHEDRRDEVGLRRGDGRGRGGR
jgi:PAS domain S-box-containing protein